MSIKKGGPEGPYILEAIASHLKGFIKGLFMSLPFFFVVCSDFEGWISGSSIKDLKPGRLVSNCEVKFVSAV